MSEWKVCIENKNLVRESIQNLFISKYKCKYRFKNECMKIYFKIWKYSMFKKVGVQRIWMNKNLLMKFEQENWARKFSYPCLSLRSRLNVWKSMVGNLYLNLKIFSV